MDTQERLENYESVKARIKQEGLDYCFIHYSNFEEIEDKEFHKLRNAYIKASENIQQYVKDQIEKLQNEDGE